MLILAFAASTRRDIKAGKDLKGNGFDLHKIINTGFEAVKVKERIELFGSGNNVLF